MPEFAIIIPAADEEACIGPVLDEFLAVLDPEKFVIAVGVNGSSDRTAESRVSDRCWSPRLSGADMVTAARQRST